MACESAINQEVIGGVECLAGVAFVSGVVKAGIAAVCTVGASEIGNLSVFSRRTRNYACASIQVVPHSANGGAAETIGGRGLAGGAEHVAGLAF